MSDEAPRAFISYSHDSEEHKARVLALAEALRANAIDVHLDQWEPAPREGFPRWMTTQIQEARFVLVVCTDTYRERAEGRNSPDAGAGANYEGLIINQELFDANGINDKFVPILFDVTPDSRPGFLAPYRYYR